MSPAHLYFISKKNDYYGNNKNQVQVLFGRRQRGHVMLSSDTRAADPCVSVWRKTRNG